MPTPAPLISIIIVCKNPGKRLEITIESIVRQESKDYEIVVIDGDSQDGTRDWIASRRSLFGAVLIEPDTGIYDAMNKGVTLSRGDWVFFLGAGDILADHKVLERVRPWLVSRNGAVATGEIVYDDGRQFRMKNTKTASHRNFLHHQGTFYRRKLLDPGMSFDQSLSIAADYDLNLKLLKKNIPFTLMPVRIAICSSGGVSDNGLWVAYREEIVVRHRHFPSHISLIWDIGSVFRYLRKKILRSCARQRPEYLPSPNRPETK